MKLSEIKIGMRVGSVYGGKEFGTVERIALDDHMVWVRFHNPDNDAIDLLDVDPEDLRAADDSPDTKEKP